MFLVITEEIHSIHNSLKVIKNHIHKGILCEYDLKTGNLVNKITGELVEPVDYTEEFIIEL